MSVSDMLEAMRPFLWLALAAFFAGFLSYVVVGGPGAAAKIAPADYAPVASAPSSDEWNLPKHV
jgi:hypothetical protein